MRYLIAGLGSIGRRHLRNLLALGENDIVLFRTNKSTITGQDLPDIPVETDLRSALNRSPDAVIISNPTSLHLDVAIPAAESGCDLMIEKPISNDLNGLDRLESIAEHNDIQVLNAFQFRFHPGLQLIKDLLKNEVIGKPVSVHAHWGEYLPAWHPWENYRQAYSARADLGGGVLLTLCHPLDYLRWLLGEVQEVSSIYGSLGGLDLEVEDTAEVMLRFASGITGNVHLDYIESPPDHHLRITGTEGKIFWDNQNGCVDVFSREKEEHQSYPLRSGFDRNDLFLQEMQHFIDLVNGKTQSICDLQDGVQSLKIALAALESQKLKKFIAID